MPYTESDLIMPAMMFIASEKEGITTSGLIKQLDELLKPTGKDIQILSGRHDTHFSQKVRNLVSHKTLEKKRLVNYTKISRNGLFKITPLGEKYIIDNGDGFDFIMNNGFSETQREKIIKNDFSNLVIEEGYIRSSQVIIRKRSSKLVTLAKKHFAIKNKIYCESCQFNFEDFYGSLGKGFIEIHHLKPIFTYEENVEQSLKEALKNVVPVCSNCHRIIHRNNSNLLTINHLKNIIDEQRNMSSKRTA